MIERFEEDMITLKKGSKEFTRCLNSMKTSLKN